MNNMTFLEDKIQLNLQLNADGVWECRGRIQGEYQVYLSDRYQVYLSVSVSLSGAVNKSRNGRIHQEPETFHS